jgi:hypothetical protein
MPLVDRGLAVLQSATGARVIEIRQPRPWISTLGGGLTVPVTGPDDGHEWSRDAFDLD